MEDAARPKAETTQEPSGPVKIEKAVSEFVAAFEQGRLDRWKQRVNGKDSLRRLLQQLGPRYTRCSLSNYQIYHPNQQPVVDRLLAFTEAMPDRLSQGGGLILLGPQGTGKDHLLAAVLKIAAARYRYAVSWWDGGNLFDMMAKAITGDTWEKERKRLVEPHVLAISDPVAPRGPLSDAQLRRLRDVIDRRYRERVGTWITTNVDSREDAERLLTEPVMARIREGSEQIVCSWPSYRERSV
jgi:DNA replication protein DnaC